VVTVNYSGRLISGHVFDNSWERGYPEPSESANLSRASETALLDMHIGDRPRGVHPLANVAMASAQPTTSPASQR